LENATNPPKIAKAILESPMQALQEAESPNETNAVIPTKLAKAISSASARNGARPGFSVQAERKVDSDDRLRKTINAWSGMLAHAYEKYKSVG